MAQQLYQLQYWTLVTSIAIPIVAAILACWLASHFARRAVNEQTRITFYIEKHVDTLSQLYRHLCIVQNDFHRLMKPVTSQAEVDKYSTYWRAACEHMEGFLELFYASQIIIDRQLIQQIEAFIRESESTVDKLAIHKNIGLSPGDEQVRQRLAEEAERRLFTMRARIGWYCQDLLTGSRPLLPNPPARKRFSFNLRSLKFWGRRKAKTPEAK